MKQIEKILLPTRPQPDTIVAIFLLKQFGGAKYPGIEHAVVETRATLDPEETPEVLLAQGILTLDLGGTELDHHGKELCTSELVAKHLNIEKDPSLTRLLAYARRDDKEGKGTLSTDAIDRALGLSGLISSLNKYHVHEPNTVVSHILPLLFAYWHSAHEHHIALPKEVEQKKQTGDYEERTASHTGKKLLVSFVVSDKPSMPTFLRSQQGPHADVVVQKSETTNHICILSRQERNINLSNVMGLIRLREAQLRGLELSDDLTYLGQTGRIAEIPYWYYDPATKSLLNGGVHNKNVEESKIDWDELKKIVVAGLELPKQ